MSGYMEVQCRVRVNLANDAGWVQLEYDGKQITDPAEQQFVQDMFALLAKLNGAAEVLEPQPASDAEGLSS